VNIRVSVPPASADGVFPAMRGSSLINEFRKIERLMPIVAETQQIADRRNSPLKS